jgi:hypothetical protein
MNHSELIQLMHAVLDGEATRGEIVELERLLAADPAARAEFKELRWLFDGLSRVPRAFPPEGLVASVMANIPHRPSRPTLFRQLFSQPRVIIAANMDAPGKSRGESVRVYPASQLGPYIRGENMSEHKSGFSGKRKIWIGGGIAAAAAILAVALGTDFPPSGKDTMGTIVPAKRYQAPQNTADGVTLGNQSATQSTPAISASQTALGNQAADKSFNGATDKSFNGATDKSFNGATDKSFNGATDKSFNGATDKSFNGATDKSFNGATDKSFNGATDKSFNGATDKSFNGATDKSFNGATDKSFNGATDKSFNGATDKSFNGATDKSFNGATDKAFNGATDKAFNSSVNKATSN